MALEDMAEAKPGETISSREHNRITTNVRDLDERVSGMEAGAIRYRVERQTGGNFPKDGAISWPDNPQYANGITRTRNNTAFRLATPGMYLVIASIGITGNVSSGSRLILNVAMVEDTAAGFGENTALLPASYPALQTVAPVLVTQPLEFSVFVWTNSTATLPIYTTNNARTSCTITYLGGGA